MAIISKQAQQQQYGRKRNLLKMYIIFEKCAVMTQIKYFLD